jgi:hypothetical protein
MGENVNEHKILFGKFTVRYHKFEDLVVDRGIILKYNTNK